MQPQVHRVDTDLRRIAAEGGGVDAVVARTVVLWLEVARALVPIIGQRGMSALYGRALHLASAERPWLADAHGADGESPAFTALAESLSHQGVDDAIASVATLFDTFDRLLVTLIGTSLTERLLQPIWDVPSAGPTRQDTAP